MKLPKAKRINSEKYLAGLSLFKKKFAKIKLSANESALGPSPKAIKEYYKISKSFKRYPDSEGTTLRHDIAKKFKLDPSKIILGSGSDQILELKTNSELLKTLYPLDVVATAPSAEYDFISRYFWPASGGDEDYVTGSIHTGLAPYWAQQFGKTTLSAYQASSRGGHLICKVNDTTVTLTGHAVRYLKGTIYI